jgi:pimeloyl-ACP methyl ester carboxylesterase
MNINYQDKGSGQSIVLMHGWGGSSASLAGLAEELIAKGYRVINIDLPGFGKSELDRLSYNMQDYVAAVYNLINHLELKNPILLGHSFGGKLGIFFVQRYPKLISKLILINSSGINPGKSRRGRITYKIAKSFTKVLKLPIIKLFAEKMRYFYYRFIVKEMDYYKNINLRDTFKVIVQEHANKFLSEIKCPTLIIWGKEDRVTPLWQGQKLHKSILNSEMTVFDDFGHNLPLINPKPVAQYVANWLNK